MSAQAAAGAAAVVDAATVGAAAVAAGGLLWVGVEIVPQPARTQSTATAAPAAIEGRRGRWSRIWMFS
jgi:hypothetical protein